MTTHALCEFFHAKYDLVPLSANKLDVFHSVALVVASIPSSGYDGSQKEDRYCSLSCMDLLVLATATFHSQWIWEVSPIRHRLAIKLIISSCMKWSFSIETPDSPGMRLAQTSSELVLFSPSPLPKMVLFSNGIVTWLYGGTKQELVLVHVSIQSGNKI
jgi:hypothetical protein